MNITINNGQCGERVKKEWTGFALGLVDHIQQKFTDQVIAIHCLFMSNATKPFDLDMELWVTINFNSKFCGFEVFNRISLQGNEFKIESERMEIGETTDLGEEEFWKKYTKAKFDFLCKVIKRDFLKYKKSKKQEVDEFMILGDQFLESFPKNEVVGTLFNDLLQNLSGVVGGLQS